MGGTSKHDEHIITWSGERVGIEQIGITEMPLANGYIQTKPYGSWM